MAYHLGITNDLWINSNINELLKKSSKFYRLAVKGAENVKVMDS